MIQDIEFCCCFCNKGIEQEKIDPCEIIIITNWGKPKNYQHAQNFWCHFECFKGKLHEEIQIDLVVHLLTPRKD